MARGKGVSRSSRDDWHGQREQALIWVKRPRHAAKPARYVQRSDRAGFQLVLLYTETSVNVRAPPPCWEIEELM